LLVEGAGGRGEIPGIFPDPGANREYVPGSAETISRFGQKNSRFGWFGNFAAIL
jgi:hypothetical protein